MGVVGALLLVPTKAVADDRFGATGRNVFVVEGLAGLASYRKVHPDDNVERGARVHVGVFGMVPFTRLGYHRFVGRSISLGLGAQFLKTDASFYYGNDATMWGLSPRVGWSVPIASTAAFWLRAGLGLTSAKGEGTRSGQISLGGEAILVVHPARDFAIMMVTFIERGIAGREIVDSTNTGRAVRFHMLGVALGVAVAF